MMDAAVARAVLDALIDGDAPPGSPHHRRRMQILTAATALFVDRGFKKTSVSEIARRAEVTKPTVYAHYQSKAHLLLHAIMSEKRAYFDRIAPHLDTSKPPRERLKNLIAQSLVLAQQMPLTSRLLQGERDILFALSELDDARRLAPSDGARDEALRTGFYEDLLAGFAADTLSVKERRERAKVIVALTFCSGVLAEDDLRQGLSFERLASLLATMLVDGIDAPLPE